jgi:hypothetical protein
MLGWSYMNETLHDMARNGMLFDVSASPKNKKVVKHLILIRLKWSLTTNFYGKSYIQNWNRINSRLLEMKIFCKHGRTCHLTMMSFSFKYTLRLQLYGNIFHKGNIEAVPTKCLFYDITFRSSVILLLTLYTINRGGFYWRRLFLIRQKHIKQ